MAQIFSFLLRGTTAERPPFGKEGRLYADTDTRELLYDTGTAWEVIATIGGESVPSNAPVDYIDFVDHDLRDIANPEGGGRVYLSGGFLRRRKPDSYEETIPYMTESPTAFGGWITQEKIITRPRIIPAGQAAFLPAPLIIEVGGSLQIDGELIIANPSRFA